MSRIAIKTVGEQMDQAQRIEDTSKLLERIHALEQALGEAQKFRETACDENSRMCIEICNLKSQLDAAQSSQQICVGAAGIGDFSEMCGWIDNAKSKLRAFEESIERCSKPEWSEYLNTLAERLDFTGALPIRTMPRDVSDLKRAARELRYMATSFTLKANFVPAELRIAKYEKALKFYADDRVWLVDESWHDAGKIARDALGESK